ncbi:MAG: protein-glutamate O-methyltransferase CheR [Trichocoleus desertorum ATA4-8-CV12]|jgi:two-component system CheB/CheR fusion protein|nr:protein-glutamate O-methyltransferase CheR [Trichocoleus desertorum ATA4-8-CV12]
MHPPQTQSEQALQRNPAFEKLLDYLKQSHGFSFTEYKPSSLMRRVQLRMEQVGIDAYSDYTTYLQANPDEFGFLFNTIEINVTDFFRDPLAWEYLVTEIIPWIRDQKKADEPIRLWSAGCASGEEVYSLAMTLAEVLGIEQYQERVRIFASDVDVEALEQARQGCYAANRIAPVPLALQERYFERDGDCYRVRLELRKPLLFFRHNLLEDPPMSKIDLLVCRNALIYFNCVGQNKALVRFYFSLRSTGILFLGSSESLPQQHRLFRTLSMKHHMFSKADKSSLTPSLLVQALRRSLPV